MHKTIDQNTQGRDYILPDLHGRFDLLARAMFSVNFDTKKDRLFLLGDMIDRGPNSADVLQILSGKIAHYKNVQVHALLGNHEAAIINHEKNLKDLNLKKKQRREWRESNYNEQGREWLLGLPEDQLVHTVDQLSKLPYAIELNTGIGLMGLVHAEVLENDWQEFIHNLYHEPVTKHHVVWSRKRILNGDLNSISSIVRLYSGHTVINHPILLGNRLYMDTGAVFRDNIVIAQADIDRVTLNDRLISLPQHNVLKLVV